MYDGLKHSCLEGNHIVNIFSFSKAYGMMGWRVGYVSYALMRISCSLLYLDQHRKDTYEILQNFEWSISLLRTNCASIETKI